MVVAKKVHPRRHWIRLGFAALAVVGFGLWWSWDALVPSAVTRGLAAYKRGDWRAADRLAEEDLRIAKHNPEGMRLLARASARLGRYRKAWEIYNSLSPQTLEAEDYFLLGLVKVLSGQLIEGRGSLNLALAADPDHGEALDLFAKVALQTAQVSEAMHAADRLAHLPGWEARGDLHRGVIYATDQNPIGAVRALRRAIERDPTIRIVPSDRFSTLRLLARSLLQVERPGEAQGALRTVLDAGPDREASWLSSRSYLQEGRSADAATALAKAGTYRAEHPLEPEPAPYVGEARCTACHSEVREEVVASRHGRTFRRGRDLVGLPLPDRPLTDPGDPEVSHTLKRVEGQLRVETHVRGRVLRAVVDYALGSSDRYTSLIGRDDQGRSRTLRLSYHRGAEGAGWDMSKAQAAHPRRADDFLGEPFQSIAESHECLVCHTTNARAVRDQIGPESQDRAIGCERCHGPGGLHSAAVAVRFPEPAIASPAKASSAEISQLCGDCHSQHFLTMPASRTAPDWTRFPGSTLPWSRCYIESGGTLSCVTCHDPHKNAESAPGYYEAKCRSCHSSSRTTSGASVASGVPLAKPGPASRSSCPVNPSGDCLRCHMPKVRYEWLHGDFTDHYIRAHRPEE